MRPRHLLILASLVTSTASARADVAPADALFFFDFREGTTDLAKGGRPMRLNGVKSVKGQPLEFTRADQFAEMDSAAMAALSRRLDGIEALSVGGWFLTRRNGEQVLLRRGLPETGTLGERRFPPNPDWVNFCLGTDPHGFLMGTVHGNGTMPFVHVTLNELRELTWNQIVIAKDAQGFQKFYQNGTLVHTDRDSAWAPKVRPFQETGKGNPESVLVAAPLGGQVGEAWAFARELTAEEIRNDFESKRGRCKPAPPGKPFPLRAMDAHNTAGLRKTLPTKADWPKERERILSAALKVLGPFPKEKVPLDPKVISETDCGSYVRRKVTIAVQPDDRMPFYLLVPKKREGKVPAIICFYGTTSGAGKETTVGLSGGKPGTPPEKNRGFAVDFAEAGFVVLAADYLRDGERVHPGDRPYDTARFYKQFPDWSVHGKDVWDTMRAIDYLRTLEFVDGVRIGMVGHSYGGHSTIFTAAVEPRIKVAVANGPVSAFREHGGHWAVPKGAGNSQSMPALREYLLDPDKRLPLTFYEFTALIAPRPLLVGQAVGERRPTEEENHAAVRQVYEALGEGKKVRYHWYPGDHDFPPAARRAAVEWFRTWLR
jgi:dienelactone hydrolase